MCVCVGILLLISYLSLNNYYHLLLIIVSVVKGFFKSDLLLPPAGVKLLPLSELMEGGREKEREGGRKREREGERERGKEKEREGRRKRRWDIVKV